MMISRVPPSALYSSGFAAGSCCSSRSPASKNAELLVLRHEVAVRSSSTPASQTIGLYADPARVLRVRDSDGRALHIACGAALFNLRLAAAVDGRQPVVRLIPDRASGCCSRLSGWPGHLSRSSRRLSCTPPSRSAVPTGARSVIAHGYRPGVLAELAEAARIEGTVLHIPDRQEARGLLRLAQDAERGRLRRGFPNAEQPPAPGRCRPRDRGRGAAGRRIVPALRTGFRLASRSANTWSRSSRPPSPHPRSCSSWCLTRRLIGPCLLLGAVATTPSGPVNDTIVGARLCAPRAGLRLNFAAFAALAIVGRTPCPHWRGRAIPRRAPTSRGQLLRRRTRSIPSWVGTGVRWSLIARPRLLCRRSLNRPRRRPAFAISWRHQSSAWLKVSTSDV